jgi:hypothetical protein
LAFQLSQILYFSAFISAIVIVGFQQTLWCYFSQLAFNPPIDAIHEFKPPQVFSTFVSSIFFPKFQLKIKSYLS